MISQPGAQCPPTVASNWRSAHWTGNVNAFECILYPPFPPPSPAPYLPNKAPAPPPPTCWDQCYYDEDCDNCMNDDTQGFRCDGSSSIDECESHCSDQCGLSVSSPPPPPPLFVVEPPLILLTLPPPPPPQLQCQPIGAFFPGTSCNDLNRACSSSADCKRAGFDAWAGTSCTGCAGGGCLANSDIDWYYFQCASGQCIDDDCRRRRLSEEEGAANASSSSWAESECCSCQPLAEEMKRKREERQRRERRRKL